MAGVPRPRTPPTHPLTPEAPPPTTRRRGFSRPRLADSRRGRPKAPTPYARRFSETSAGSRYAPALPRRPRLPLRDLRPLLRESAGPRCGRRSRRHSENRGPALPEGRHARMWRVSPRTAPRCGVATLRDSAPRRPIPPSTRHRTLPSYAPIPPSTRHRKPPSYAPIPPNPPSPLLGGFSATTKNRQRRKTACYPSLVVGGLVVGPLESVFWEQEIPLGGCSSLFSDFRTPESRIVPPARC